MKRVARGIMAFFAFVFVFLLLVMFGLGLAVTNVIESHSPDKSVVTYEDTSEVINTALVTTVNTN